MWNLVTTAAALLILIPMLGNVTRHAGETTADAAVCHQLATTAALGDAAVAYVIANHASPGIGAGDTVSSGPSTLIAACQLPPIRTGSRCGRNECASKVRTRWMA